MGRYLNFKRKLFNQRNIGNYQNVLSVNFKLVLLLLLLLKTFILCTFFLETSINIFIFFLVFCQPRSKGLSS